MKKETKTFLASIEFKADSDETGEFKAVFSTFGVVDLDRDVTEPGAFKAGQETFVESWNHGYDLPVGKGVIGQDEKEGWLDGKFFLDTPGGEAHYRTVKNAGGIVEWSYTFSILESSFGKFEDQDVRFLKSLDVVGVSPVTRGAGINTRTVAVKNAGQDEDEADQGKSSVDAQAKISLIGLMVKKAEMEA